MFSINLIYNGQTEIFQVPQVPSRGDVIVHKKHGALSVKEVAYDLVQENVGCRVFVTVVDS